LPHKLLSPFLFVAVSLVKQRYTLRVIMSEKKVYQCEDSLEGILTAVYEAWSSRNGHANNEIRILSGDNQGDMELFTEYIVVKNSEEKIAKVIKAVYEKISSEAYELICSAACSCELSRGDDIYRFLIVGFSVGKGIVDQLHNKYVMRIFELTRNVSNEAHHLKGFLRFQEIEEGILVAKLAPKNDVIRILAPHFSDRLCQENFIIYDENRNTAIVHGENKEWFYTDGSMLDVDRIKNVSEREESIDSMWKAFFRTISIKERENKNLQRNNLPIRFRSNMTEFE